MFPRHKVTGVTSKGITTTKNWATPVNANISLGNAGSTNLNISSYTNSQYSYYLTGLLPANPDLADSASLALFYRDIYQFDNVGGSAVDIMSSFPFSDWELRGLEEDDLKIFNDGLDRLNLKELLPQLSLSYLTDGYYAGSLVYDPKAKNFMDILTHDSLQCAITPSPFNNVDPTVRVTVSGATQQFINGATEYASQYLATMPEQFVKLLKEGSFILDPVTTLFIARRALTDRAYMSYLHRLLPMYLIEKTMYRGTLVEANRRQRAMTHITAGDDIWTPTTEELSMLVQQFQMAEQDPMGGWITTRNSVQAQDLRPGGEFWKWTDMSDVLVAYKLRALGISEALLSGDASYAAAESAYSTFLETTNAYRSHLTNSIFYKKLFPLLAISNKLFKDPSKQRDTDRIVDFLFNANNRNNLKQPVLHWHKNLTAKTEDNMMDMLEKVQEKGVPIPIKMWLAAAGIDKDTLIRDASEDKEIQEKLAHIKESMGGEGAPAESSEDVEDGMNPGLASVSINSSFVPKRKSILDRDFGSGDLFELTRTGKKKHVLNQEAKKRDINWKIAKVAARADSDPNYREELRKRNMARTGSDKLKDF
jgi:hypothetical protein